MTIAENLGEVLTRLYAIIESRKGADPTDSYTAQLLEAGPARCAKKFGEEAIEAAIAGATGETSDLTAEAADVLYHLLVLMAANGVTPGEVASILAVREGVSGHVEQASRK